MREILALRQEEAQLLGYASFAELSIVPKMAESPAQVIAFLRDLADRARPHAERDLAELREFARTELGLPDLQAWDLAVRVGATEGEALRLQRPGGQAVLHRAEGARGAVPHRRDAVRRAASGRTARRSGTRRVRFFRIERHSLDSARQRTRRPVLPRPACPPRQAARRMDGRRARALGAPGGLAADAGGRISSATSRRRWPSTVSCVRRC